MDRIKEVANKKCIKYWIKHITVKHQSWPQMKQWCNGGVGIKEVADSTNVVNDELN